MQMVHGCLHPSVSWQMGHNSSLITDGAICVVVLHFLLPRAIDIHFSIEQAAYIFGCGCVCDEEYDVYVGDGGTCSCRVYSSAVE